MAAQNQSMDDVTGGTTNGKPSRICVRYAPAIYVFAEYSRRQVAWTAIAGPNG